MGWKMVYTVLDADEKTKRILRTFDQNIRTVYSNKPPTLSHWNAILAKPSYHFAYLSLQSLIVILQTCVSVMYKCIRTLFRTEPISERLSIKEDRNSVFYSKSEFSNCILLRVLCVRGDLCEFKH